MIDEGGGYYNVDTKRFVEDHTKEEGTFETGNITILGILAGLVPGKINVPYHVKLSESIRGRAEEAQTYSAYLQGGVVLAKMDRVDLDHQPLGRFPESMLVPDDWVKPVLSVNYPLRGGELPAAGSLNADMKVLQNERNPLMAACLIQRMFDREGPQAYTLLGRRLDSGDTYLQAFAVYAAFSNTSGELSQKTVRQILKLLDGSNEPEAYAIGLGAYAAADSKDFSPPDISKVRKALKLISSRWKSARLNELIKAMATSA